MLFWLTLFIQTTSAQTATDQLNIQHLLESKSNSSSLNDRLAYVSQAWIGRPYLNNGPLGEGENGVYDQDPLYRTDGFDCTTFVETTLAVAQAANVDDFLNILNHIRYQDGVIDFTKRNHFIEIDWNPNNESAGFLKENTVESATKPEQLAESIVNISKKNWYQNMTLASLKLHTLNPVLLLERLTQLRAEGSRFENVLSRLPYLKKAFVKNLTPTMAPAVLNLLRDFKNPNGSISSVISHQVLLIEVDGKLRIRQASSKATTLRVIDQSLDAFAQDLLTSASVRGINIQKLNDR
jgi:hypothetical protein